MAQTFRLLVVDQFCPGTTPAELNRHPIQFNDLVSKMLAARDAGEWLGYRRPELIDATEDWHPPTIGVTTIREGADGCAEVWRYSWDSSG